MSCYVCILQNLNTVQNTQLGVVSRAFFLAIGIQCRNFLNSWKNPAIDVSHIMFSQPECI